MTEPNRIIHHRSTDFAEIDYPLQDGFSVITSADGRRIEVTGVCPGCGGNTTTAFEYGVAGYKGFPGRRKPDPSRPSGPRTVYCECGHWHPNRPAEATDNGCGAFWSVVLG